VIRDDDRQLAEAVLETGLLLPPALRLKGTSRKAAYGSRTQNNLMALAGVVSAWSADEAFGWAGTRDGVSNDDFVILQRGSSFTKAEEHTDVRRHVKASADDRSE